MNWVDSRYISVDNGILTFKAPPSAVVPAVSEDTAKKKEKKPKENLPPGVPALATVINAYITDYGGGSVMDLKARIKYYLKDKQTDKQATTVITSLKKYLETWFEPFVKRGKRVKGNWEKPYQPPDLDDIQAKLGDFLQNGTEWKEFLITPKKPASKTDDVPKEHSSEADDTPFPILKRLVATYETQFMDRWNANDQNRWASNDPVFNRIGFTHIPMLHDIMFTINGMLGKRNRAEENEKMDSDDENRELDDIDVTSLYNEIITMANATLAKIVNLDKTRTEFDLSKSSKDREIIQQLVAELKSAGVDAELKKLIEMSEERKG